MSIRGASAGMRPFIVGRLSLTTPCGLSPRLLPLTRITATRSPRRISVRTGFYLAPFIVTGDNLSGGM
jgi:hypothetical protein